MNPTTERARFNRALDGFTQLTEALVDDPLRPIEPAYEPRLRALRARAMELMAASLALAPTADPVENTVAVVDPTMAAQGETRAAEPEPDESEPTRPDEPLAPLSPEGGWLGGDAASVRVWRYSPSEMRLLRRGLTTRPALRELARIHQLAVLGRLAQADELPRGSLTRWWRDEPLPPGWRLHDLCSGTDAIVIMKVG